MPQIGRYQIQGELGRGAMGLVYAASDPLIGRQVAIKIIHMSELKDSESREDLRQRLYREARMAGILSHPGIVTIHDIGEQEGEAFIVMELVNGTTLESILSSKIPQHTGFLLAVIEKAAEALDYAHCKGVVHRDIKPSNIMVGQDGTVKIADFGIAKVSASTKMTQTGLVLGTPNYMSPEQAQAFPLDCRTDQFSLGVVAFQILTGELPFRGPTLTAVLAKILWSEPHFENANLDPQVQSVLLKALAKKPKDRYASCAEFASELARAYLVNRPEVFAPPEVQGKPLIQASDAIPSHSVEGVTPQEAEEVKLETSDIVTPLSSPQERMEPEESASVSSRPTVEAGPPLIMGKPERRPNRIGLAIGIAAVSLILVLSVILRRYFSSVPHVASVQTAATPAVTATPLAPANQPPSAPRSMPGPESGQPSAAATKPAPAEKVIPEATERRTSQGGQPSATKAKKATEVGLLNGAITWSDRLQKNSILVIQGDKASIGSVTGQLPGVPVEIDVNPPTLEIRQRPSPENNWKQIMLYSGNQRHTSITIRWIASK